MEELYCVRSVLSPFDWCLFTTRILRFQGASSSQCLLQSWAVVDTDLRQNIAIYNDKGLGLRSKKCENIKMTATLSL